MSDTNTETKHNNTLTDLDKLNAVVEITKAFATSQNARDHHVSIVLKEVIAIIDKRYGV